LADINGDIMTAYDVDGGGYAKRVTFAIDETGNIVLVDASVKTETHANDVLKALGY
jgi:thioredoxin-dependent peroxiredoxin